MKKLFLSFFGAPLYREAIYKAIDDNFICDWNIGIGKSKVKQMNFKELKNVNSVKLKFILKTPFYWQKGILKSIQNNNYDEYIFIGDYFNLSIWIFLIFNFKYKRKVLLWTHGWYGKESKIEKIIKKIFFKMANAILLYGEYAKKLMLKEGFENKKLYVIHNSLNYNVQLNIRKKLKDKSIYQDRFQNKNPVIIFIGRLTKIKKLSQILYAMRILKDRHVYINFTLIGDGSEMSSLRQLSNELGISNQIWFLGESFNEEDNAKYIYNADICVSPGNVGLTAIHSLMFGTPVITHNNFPYQMPEFESIIPDITGNFFIFNDISSLADSIEKWIFEEKDRNEVRKKCFNEIDKSWNPNFQIGVINSTLD